MDELTQRYRTLPHAEKTQCAEFVVQGLGQKYCHSGDVVVDAGANFGAHTTTFCQAVGATGKVVAFEANPSVAQKLSGFCRNYPWLTVHGTALSDQTGEATFFAAKASGWSSLLGQPRADLEGETITVKTETLDDALRPHEINSLRFMKVDVEGAEVALLRGAVDTLRQFNPLVVIELSWKRAVGPSVEDRSKFLEFIGSLGSDGYKLYDLCGNPIDAEEAREYMLLLVPNTIEAKSVIDLARSRIVQYMESDRKWTLYSKFK